MPFNGLVEESIDGGGSPVWLELVSQFGGRLLLFGIAAMLILSLKRNLGRLVSEGFPAGSGGRRRSAAAIDSGPTMDMDSVNSDQQMVDEVKNFAEGNPERVAEVIQSWINEND